MGQRIFRHPGTRPTPYRPCCHRSDARRRLTHPCPHARARPCTPLGCSDTARQIARSTSYGTRSSEPSPDARKPLGYAGVPRVVFVARAGYEPRDLNPRPVVSPSTEITVLREAGNDGSAATDARLRPSGYELLVEVSRQFSLLLDSARYPGFRGIEMMADTRR